MRNRTWTWIRVTLAAPLVLQLLMTFGGCFYARHDDRGDHDRDAEIRVRVDAEHHDDHHDADQQDRH